MAVVENPVNFQANPVSSSQITLTWEKNTSGNNVILVYSPTGTFGIPQEGTFYSAGNSIPGGGAVLYRGSNVSFAHTGLTENTFHYYKAYSYTSVYAYS